MLYGTTCPVACNINIVMRMDSWFTNISYTSICGIHYDLYYYDASKAKGLLLKL